MKKNKTKLKIEIFLMEWKRFMEDEKNSDLCITVYYLNLREVFLYGINEEEKIDFLKLVVENINETLEKNKDDLNYFNNSLYPDWLFIVAGLTGEDIWHRVDINTPLLDRYIRCKNFLVNKLKISEVLNDNI